MSDELHNNEPTEEPSVLDYVKSLFRFGGAERISLPKFVEQERPAPVASDRSTIAYLRSLTRFPWRSLLALLLALLGQSLFEPPPPPADASAPSTPPPPPSAGGGAPLPSAARARFEARLGERFDDVRIHTDAASAREADTLGARAFTRGLHIYFAHPADAQVAGNERLIAHELAHVVQQRAEPALAQHPLLQPKGSVEFVSVQLEVKLDRKVDEREFLVLLLMQHFDVPDADTLVGHRSEYRCETSAQTHRGVVVHCVGCVLDGETEARFEDGDQRQHPRGAMPHVPLPGPYTHRTLSEHRGEAHLVAARSGPRRAVR